MFCWLWQRVLREHSRHFIYFQNVSFLIFFFLDKKKQQINKKQTNNAKQGTYCKLIEKINRSLSRKYC